MLSNHHNFNSFSYETNAVEKDSSIRFQITRRNTAISAHVKQRMVKKENLSQ